MIDFIQNYATIGRTRYDLDKIRAYLLEVHPTLCSNNFVKVITVKGKRVFSYDWQTILEIAEVAGYINDFHKQQTHESIEKQVTGSMVRPD